MGLQQRAAGGRAEADWRCAARLRLRLRLRLRVSRWSSWIDVVLWCCGVVVLRARAT